MSLSDSDSESESEEKEIDIDELKRRMWKNRMLLSELQGFTSKHQAQADHQIVPCDNPFCRSPQNPPPSNRKTLQRAEDGVLRCMLKLIYDGQAHGFVYGILPKTGPPITGSSDSLRAWWKDTIAFERAAPLALVSPAEVLPVTELQSLESNLHKLQDMNDNTIGSILSVLVQHCQPPQKSFPFNQKIAPPWWPMGEETWWGVQGQAHAQLGPPPYKKPHDLRKGWKLNLLAAVIRHMSPRFDQMRNLVWQSKRLQHKMSAKDVETWLGVIRQEKALVEQTKRSPLVAYSDIHNGGTSDAHYNISDDTTDGRQRRRHEDWRSGNWSENGNGNWREGDLPSEGSLHDEGLEMNSIHELMMSLYPQA